MFRKLFWAALALTTAAAGQGTALSAGPGSSAGAVPDVIGIYFDTEAEEHCVSLPIGLHHAYLTATHVSAPAGIAGWECIILTDGPLTVIAWDLLGGAINIPPPPQFRVGLITPMPWSEAMVLLDIHFQVEAEDQPILFYVHPWFVPSFGDGPLYSPAHDPGDFRLFHQSTGGPDFPVAVVNGECSVPTATRTWGEVKALFR